MLFFKVSVKDRKLLITYPSTMLPSDVILYVRCLWSNNLLSLVLKPASIGVFLQMYSWKSRKFIYGSLSLIGKSIRMHPSSLAMYGNSPLFLILLTGLPIWKSAILSVFLGRRSTIMIFYELSAIKAFRVYLGPPYWKICTSLMPHFKF